MIKYPRERFFEKNIEKLNHLSKLPPPKIGNTIGHGIYLGLNPENINLSFIKNVFKNLE